MSASIKREQQELTPEEKRDLLKFDFFLSELIKMEVVREACYEVIIEFMFSKSSISQHLASKLNGKTYSSCNNKFRFLQLIHKIILRNSNENRNLILKSIEGYLCSIFVNVFKEYKKDKHFVDTIKVMRLSWVSSINTKVFEKIQKEIVELFNFDINRGIDIKHAEILKKFYQRNNINIKTYVPKGLTVQSKQYNETEKQNEENNLNRKDDSHVEESSEQIKYTKTDGEKAIHCDFQEETQDTKNSFKDSNLSESKVNEEPHKDKSDEQQITRQEDEEPSSTQHDKDEMDIEIQIEINSLEQKEIQLDSNHLKTKFHTKNSIGFNQSNKQNNKVLVIDDDNEDEQLENYRNKLNKFAKKRQIHDYQPSQEQSVDFEENQALKKQSFQQTNKRQGKIQQHYQNKDQSQYSDDIQNVSPSGNNSAQQNTKDENEQQELKDDQLSSNIREQNNEEREGEQEEEQEEEDEDDDENHHLKEEELLLGSSEKDSEEDEDEDIRIKKKNDLVIQNKIDKEESQSMKSYNNNRDNNQYQQYKGDRDERKSSHNHNRRDGGQRSSDKKEKKDSSKNRYRRSEDRKKWKMSEERYSKERSRKHDKKRYDDERRSRSLDKSFSSKNNGNKYDQDNGRSKRYDIYEDEDSLTRKKSKSQSSKSHSGRSRGRNNHSEKNNFIRNNQVPSSYSNITGKQKNFNNYHPNNSKESSGNFNNNNNYHNKQKDFNYPKDYLRQQQHQQEDPRQFPHPFNPNYQGEDQQWRSSFNQNGYLPIHQNGQFSNYFPNQLNHTDQYDLSQNRADMEQYYSENYIVNPAGQYDHYMGPIDGIHNNSIPPLQNQAYDNNLYQYYSQASYHNHYGEEQQNPNYHYEQQQQSENYSMQEIKPTPVDVQYNYGAQTSNKQDAAFNPTRDKYNSELTPLSSQQPAISISELQRLNNLKAMQNGDSSFALPNNTIHE